MIMLLISNLTAITGKLPLEILAGQPAYLDPGSGSFILQILLASLLGGLFVMRSYWGKLWNFLRKVIGKQQDEDE